jgi:tRNA threonylcarbamoyladenosine biosynthesis protein TsaB
MPLVEQPRIGDAGSKRDCPMRILALETTDKTGSVAALADDKPLAELILDRTQRSAQSLLPAINSLLGQIGWRPADVQLVAVSIGPGSFTGLRVGVTAAKVLAYAVGAEVLGVNTLETIAANCTDTDCNQVSVVIDAQRGQLVVQSFARQADGCFAPAGPEELVDADAWLARLQATVSPLPSEEEPEVRAREHSSPLPLGEGPGVRPGKRSGFRAQDSGIHPSSLILHPSSIVTGPGLARLRGRLPPGVVAMDENLWHPRAAAVARLAARHYAQGHRDDLWKLVPHYYRRSAAEEKWDEGLFQVSSQRKWDCPS